MSAEGLLGTEEEQAARRLIERANDALGALDPNVPRNFLPDLYGRAAADDLAGCPPDMLAQLGRDSWHFLRTRRPGVPKIRFQTVQHVEADDQLRPVSVIDIVTDDMPFLVDSVLSELSENGLDLRLVVHPVFTVQRDPEGHLGVFAGDAPVREGGLRESVMQIH